MRECKTALGFCTMARAGQYCIHEPAQLLPEACDDTSLWGPYELPSPSEQEAGIHFWPLGALSNDRQLPRSLNGETVNHYRTAINNYDRWCDMLQRAHEHGLLTAGEVNHRSLPPRHPTAVSAAACLNCLRHRPLLVVAKQSR